MISGGLAKFATGRWLGGDTPAVATAGRVRTASPECPRAALEGFWRVIRRMILGGLAKFATGRWLGGDTPAVATLVGCEQPARSVPERLSRDFGG